MAAKTRSPKKDENPAASDQPQQEKAPDSNASPEQGDPPDVPNTAPESDHAQHRESGPPADQGEDLPYTDLAEATSGIPDRPDQQDDEPAEEVDVTFTDTAEEPEDNNGPEDSGTTSQEDGEPQKEEPPATETLSFHIHRNLATGRATLAVSASGTDPFYRTVDHLAALDEALAMIPDLHQEARAHWEQTPRYPESQAHKQTPAPVRRPQPQPSRTATAQPAPAQTQQASLF